MDLRTPNDWNVTPFRLALAYLLFGLAALLVSDVVLPSVLRGRILRVVQGLKGAVEVLVTAVFIYLLVWISWTDLRLKERAMDEAPVGITITDPERADNPLIFTNRRFEELTGYDEAESLGLNCRFLQGPETDPETRARLREAIDDERPVSVDIRNYRKTGEAFWNKVDIAPVRDRDGTVTNFVGFQTDITDRKIREQRLAVLNRVLRHNYRNHMTVIDGYLTVLRDEADDDLVEEAIEPIERSVDDLRSLVRTARRTERILQKAQSSDSVVHLDDRVRGIVDSLEGRYPAVTITCSIPEDGPYRVDAGIDDAVEEAIENAVQHAGEDPRVAVRLTKPRPGWIEIEVEDDGPGIPENELEVLEDGETPLTHGTRMGLWMIHWIVSRSGGSLTVPRASAEGTTLRISVPDAS